jgi:hypothetical protein
MATTMKSFERKNYLLQFQDVYFQKNKSNCSGNTEKIVAIFKQPNFKILEITIFVKLLIFTFLRVLDDNFAIQITILSETTF